MKLHKLLWIANLALFAVIGHVTVGFFLGDGAGQELPVNTKAENGDKEISVADDISPAVNQKVILERNIFSPSRADSVKKNSQKQANLPVAKEQLQFRLLATISGDEEAACAVIENAKTKIQDLYKIGDIVGGAKVEKIERNKIVLLSQGRHEVLNLYAANGEVSGPVKISEEPVVARKPGLSEVVSIVSPTEIEINSRAFLAKVGGMEAILKTMEVVPHVADGQPTGIRIKGLEDSSMARYVGLENNDVIQVINGQGTTDKRKAFQVLKKARSQSSINVQLLRNEKEKRLSFGII